MIKLLTAIFLTIACVKGDDTPGSSYCTSAPDHSCYKTGWPPCCSDDSIECPEEKPACDVVGASYCTWLDNTIAATKVVILPVAPMIMKSAPTIVLLVMWRMEVPTVPTRRTKRATSLAGQFVAILRMIVARKKSLPVMSSELPYCTYSPNYGCYEGGFPACCSDDSEECPEDQPPCNVLDGNSFCTDAPDRDCYITGWPACCEVEKINCPEEKPPCNRLGEGDADPDATDPPQEGDPDLAPSAAPGETAPPTPSSGNHMLHGSFFVLLISSIMATTTF